jgi:hypothetical protein
MFGKRGKRKGSANGSISGDSVDLVICDSKHAELIRIEGVDGRGCLPQRE